MRSILNICAYRFVSLSDTAGWRASIHPQLSAGGIKGTVLIAPEGINLFIAGDATRVREFLAWLTDHDVYAGLPIRQSWSGAVPFARLIVKVKPEIIRMNRPAIRPQDDRAPCVDAATLARWLETGVDDAGRELVTLDTRNAFEVDRGRFRGALDWRLQRFSDFPQALRARRAELEGKTVVSYCTGGIRCEKAALLMRDAGLPHVLQLDGGILKYFEQAGGRHFDGECFVFDQRGALSDSLAPALPV